MLDVFKSPKNFADLLRAALCDDGLAALDLDSLHPRPTPYFTHSGKRRILDLVCSLNIRAARDARPRQLIALLEYKSGNDAAACDQLGGYASALRRTHPDALLLAMVLFHGRSRRRTQKSEFSESAEGVPAALMRQIGRKLTGRFEYQLLNVYHPEVRQRCTELGTAAVFDVMSCIWDLSEADVARLLATGLKFEKPARKRLTHAIATYIIAVRPEYNWRRLREIEARTAPNQEDRVMEALIKSK